MRQTLLVFFILSCFDSFGQKESIHFTIPKDDVSAFAKETKHMFVGKKYALVSNHYGNQIIWCWTDNGVIDTNCCAGCLCITPAHSGKITVSSVQVVNSGNRSDTITTKDIFTGIIQPKISLKIVKDNLNGDIVLQFILIDSETGKRMPNRYQVGRMYEPKIYDVNQNTIGEMQCVSTTITKENLKEWTLEDKIKSGDKIKLNIWVRDMKTDLLIPAETLEYKFK